MHSGYPLLSRQPTRTRPSGDHHDVAMKVATCCRHRPGDWIEGGGWLPEQEFDAQGHQLFWGTRLRPITRPIAAEHLFGQGRPIVWKMIFVTDQRKSPPEPSAAQ